MAIKYLAGERIIGTAAERAALTESADIPAALCYDMSLTSGQRLGSGCWSFNGSSSHVDLTQNIIRNAFWASGSNFTIAYWFKTHTGNYMSVSMQCTNGAGEWDFFYSYPSYAASLGNNLGATYHNDAWHHVVIRYDGTDLTMSLDGSTIDATGNSSYDPATWNTATSNMVLGGKFDSPNCTTGVVGGIRSAYVLEGELDDMGIWTRALTNTEVDALYNSGSGALCSTVSSGLRVYYNFEQAVADGLTNQAGTNVIPNLPNGAIFEESDTGKHYMFDGTSAWNEIT